MPARRNAKNTNILIAKSVRMRAASVLRHAVETWLDPPAIYSEKTFFSGTLNTLIRAPHAVVRLLLSQMQ